MNTTQPTEKEFLHQRTPAVITPLLQTLITAVIVFSLTYSIAWVVFDLLDPYKPALVLAMIALMWTWTNRQKMWMSLAQWERITGIDLNNDGMIGDQVIEEEPQVHKIRIELSKVGRDGHYSSSSFNLPKGVTDEHLQQIAHDMFVLGKSFAEAELSGTGKISLPKFRQLRAVMEQQSLCEKIGTANNASFELTDIGEAWLEQYLPSPTPSVTSA